MYIVSSKLARRPAARRVRDCGLLPLEFGGHVHERQDPLAVARVLDLDRRTVIPIAELHEGRRAGSRSTVDRKWPPM